MFSRLRAWLGRAWDWVRNLTPPKWLAIALIIGVGIAVALGLMRLMVVLGPVIGAVISVIAVLGNETAKYYSSTSNLRLSLGLESKKGDSVKDPGLDVEVSEIQLWLNPNDPKSRIKIGMSFRVSAMVINDGKAVIRDVKASLTIRVRKGNQATYYLGDVLMRRNEINSYVNKFKECIEKYERNEDAQCLSNKDVLIGGILKALNCENFLVNEYNPHVIGEALAWALPEKVIPRPNKTEYVHITSISPGQRSRLLIFSYVRLSDNEYLVIPFSEYGTTGPYRACLRLDRDHEFILDITVHGEGARSPLRFSLCITYNKLVDIERAVDDLEKAVSQDRGVEQAFNNMLKALNGLRCSSTQSRAQHVIG